MQLHQPLLVPPPPWPQEVVYWVAPRLAAMVVVVPQVVVSVVRVIIQLQLQLHRQPLKCHHSWQFNNTNNNRRTQVVAAARMVSVSLFSHCSLILFSSQICENEMQRITWCTKITLIITIMISDENYIQTFWGGKYYHWTNTQERSRWGRTKKEKSEEVTTITFQGWILSLSSRSPLTTCSREGRFVKTLHITFSMGERIRDVSLS